MKVKSKIARQKLELIQWLSTIEDASVIEKMMAFRKEEQLDWWNSISEMEQKSIELGIKDADLGKLNPHSKAKELYGKWL
jgi:hypothetical protein